MPVLVQDGVAAPQCGRDHPVARLSQGVGRTEECGVILNGDSLEMLRTLPDGAARCCITSPPYWGLRDYGHAGQIGLERTPDEYVSRIVEVFREVRRVLSDDGTLWLNIGDSYASGGMSNPSAKSTLNGGKDRGASAYAISRNTEGLKPKNLVGIPWRVAFALQADGWWLRQDIIWHKPNPMPESVTDRCTEAHEYVFMLTKSKRYYFNAKAIEEKATHADTRNKRSVWTIPTQPFPEAHFAVMPEELALVCALAGLAPGDTLIDPFLGAGTVGVVAEKTGRKFIGCEINPDYVAMAKRRIAGIAPLFSDGTRGEA